MIFHDPMKLAVYVRPGRTDMRRAINGLLGIVKDSMQVDPMSQSLFLFCGRSRKIVKLLYWDGNGFCLWQKRLEKGSFAWPDDTESALRLTSEELQWLLSGIDFRRKHHPVFFKRLG